MLDLPADLLTAADDLGVRLDRVVRRTDKTLLAQGSYRECPVAVKFLLETDPFWEAKWRHETSVYQLFAQYPPPIRAPRLLAADPRLLVVEWLTGRRLADDRYPDQPCPTNDIDTVLDLVSMLHQWAPPTESLPVIFDYQERFRRYHAAGHLTDADHTALLHLLDHTGDPSEVNHGDPLASNILLDQITGPALLDWEYTGWFLPGFDLAMLHTQLGARTPHLKRRIDQLVTSVGTEVPFAVNLAAVLTRELRLHRELPAGPLRDSRLPLIEQAWQQAQDRLHDLARGRQPCTS
jgi:hypothetical protein